MARIAQWLGWIPAALLLTPGWLGSGEHEGHRPDMTEVTTTAAVTVAVAGLILGAVHGSRTARGAAAGFPGAAPGSRGAAAGFPGAAPGSRDAVAGVVARRLGLVLVATAGVAAAYFAATDAVYRHVIPIDEDLRGGPSWVPLVLAPVATAALGFGAGLLRRRPTRPLPAARWYQLAGAAAVLGVIGVTGFVGNGAEMATARFVPGATTTATSLDLPAGRHALFARYGDQPASCAVTDGGGARIAVTRPSLEFTDNSDSVVTVLSGVFDLPAAARVEVDCPGAELGPPPEVRGPLGHLLFVPVALLWLIGAAPAALLALTVWLRWRRAARAHV